MDLKKAFHPPEPKAADQIEFRDWAESAGAFAMEQPLVGFHGRLGRLIACVTAITVCGARKVYV